MLCRTKHGPLSLFKTLALSLLSSHFSSNPNPNITNPETKTTPKKPLSQTPQISLIPQIFGSANQSYVNTLCSLLSNETLQSQNLDTLLKDFKEKLNSDIVLQVLMNYRQFGRVRTLEFFSWAGIQMGFQFYDSVVEYMVDFLGRRKLFDDMKCLLLTVSSHKGQVSCRAFSSCIRFLGRQERIREALCLFQEMELRFMCKPDNFVYNNMLYVLCKKEKCGEFIDVALMIFRKIELPDTYSYSNILVGLCKFGRLEAAIEVFGEMSMVNLVPTRSAVNVLIAELCSLSAKEGAIEKVRVNDAHRPFTILVPNVGAKIGAIEPAIRVFSAVCDMGLLPSVFVISRLISELCRLGRMKEAVQVLKVIEDRKMSCVEEGYSTVIQALCQHHWVAEASHLFGRMLSQGLKPKLVVYNSIICMLCRLGNLVDVERVFEIMNKKRCQPDNVTYSALVHAYGEARNWEAAYGLLLEMLGLGLIPHFHTYSLVDKLLKEHGQMDISIKLEGKLETQILLKHCKMGRLEAAYEKLRSMLGKGFNPPMYAREAFEHAFQKNDKLEIVRELLEKMDKGCRSMEAKIKQKVS